MHLDNNQQTLRKGKHKGKSNANFDRQKSLILMSEGVLHIAVNRGLRYKTYREGVIRRRSVGLLDSCGGGAGSPHLLAVPCEPELDPQGPVLQRLLENLLLVLLLVLRVI